MINGTRRLSKTVGYQLQNDKKNRHLNTNYILIRRDDIHTFSREKNPIEYICFSTYTMELGELLAASNP